MSVRCPMAFSGMFFLSTEVRIDYKSGVRNSFRLMIVKMLTLLTDSHRTFTVSPYHQTRSHQYNTRFSENFHYFVITPQQLLVNKRPYLGVILQHPA